MTAPRPVEQGRPGQELRLEPEDEVPDVADGQVEAVDRALDPSLDLVGILADELRDVLQRQSDGIDALDDPVVEVPADALALVDDGQALDLLEQARVLDGDPGMEREGLDDALIVLRELCPAGLFGQVEVPDRPTLHGDRDAEERVHRRMVRREAGPARIDRDVRDPERAVLSDDQAKEAASTREGTDVGPRLAVDAGRDETLDDAARMDDPERRVARADQRPDLVDDDLQDLIDGLQRRDGSRRHVERVDDTRLRPEVPRPGSRSSR